MRKAADFHDTRYRDSCEGVKNSKFDDGNLHFLYQCAQMLSDFPLERDEISGPGAEIHPTK